ncbi:MAG: pilus assembly protein [Hyphomonadaceae bacterium]|nr:pilus assembly protein [Hyphomonadaceae bacterium]
MARRRSLPDLLKDTAGSTTIEFVIIFVVFMGIVFFVVEVTLYMFFMASLEKASEAGVRAAVVSSPVAPGVPLVIAKEDPGDPTQIFGYKCSHVSAPCAPFPTTSCTGATGCTAGDFDRILQHMRRFNGQIQAEDVTVTYSDAGIGFAGGPVAPMVTVTVSGVPFQAGILELVLQGPSGIATLPARSAGMTGEDLAP